MVENLIRSLKKFKIPYDIEWTEDKGSWLLNTAYKSEFIKKKLSEYGRIVWIDADGEIKKYPSYFDVIEEDIAVYYENLTTLINGCMLFKKTDVVMEVIDRWIRNCKTEPKTFEQKHLQFAIYGNFIEKRDLSVFLLPETYVCMNGISKLEPTIYFMQAHRRNPKWRELNAKKI